MAVQVTVGETYEAAKFRSGENDRGSWEMILIKGGRGQKSVVLFATNVPSGVVEGGKFKIVKIESATIKKAKDASGNWTKTEVVLHAEVEAEKTARLGEAYKDFDVEYDLDMDLF